MTSESSPKKWIGLIGLAILCAYILYIQNGRHTVASEEAAKTVKVSPAARADGYWTCSMHPTIHMVHPGECPICHMKLIHVAGDAAVDPATPTGAKRGVGQHDGVDAANESEHETLGDLAGTGAGESRGGGAAGRSSFSVSPGQMALTGVQKSRVERMDLRVAIPVAGRFLSSGVVAFQVYESDLRYIQVGLPFSGESGFYAEEHLSGKISEVDAFVDPTSRTVRVLGRLNVIQKFNSPETSFRGEIRYTLRDRVVIPESSVLHTGSGDLVYRIIGENRLMPTRVWLGVKSETYYDVLRGLVSGDEISAGPNFLIDSEARIRGAGALDDHRNH